MKFMFMNLDSELKSEFCTLLFTKGRGSKGIVLWYKKFLSDIDVKFSTFVSLINDNNWH